VIALLLGGSRSGKSAVAERLVATLPAPVTYVATAVVDRGDEAFAARIEAHRRRRPADWTTREVGRDLVAALGEVEGTVLVDALGTWVAGHDRFAVDVDGLVAALTARPGDTVVVSDEVGMGVHPSTEVGGRFRDALGVVNAAVAEVADRVALVVAGRVVPLERSPW
jgi:adenosyl cobinamide kinase/adenosyl cobinamide phosphate guanylyltransferase